MKCLCKEDEDGDEDRFRDLQIALKTASWVDLLRCLNHFYFPIVVTDKLDSELLRAMIFFVQVLCFDHKRFHGRKGKFYHRLATNTYFHPFLKNPFLLSLVFLPIVKYFSFCVTK